MNLKYLLCCLCALACCLSISHAQKNRSRFKFGDVKAEDFTPTAYEVDSTANGVYLFDAGNSYFTGNSNGFFSVVHKHHARIRLLNKNAFDLATVEFSLFGKSADAQKLDDLEAATYNLENGKVVVTKLDKASLFKDKTSDYSSQKFTFPNIKEGSIIEYSYQISTPGVHYIPTWFYQGQYPRVWSEYEVTIPVLYDFVFVKQGYHPYAVDTAKVDFASYYITDPGDAGQASASFSWSGNTINSIWAMKNVPALKEEAFTTSMSNYIAKIEFQLSATHYPNQPVKHILATWNEMAAEYMKDEDFGLGLTERNAWMDDELKALSPDSASVLEIAKKIYANVRDNYTCTDHNATYLSQSLKKVYQTKKGNVADINLLLIAMLRNRGFNADPVLLSTRSHGKAMESYPIRGKFNYVICRVEVGGQYYLLDATEPDMGFGRLPLTCFNGSGRIVSDKPYLVQLSADSLKEKASTTVFLVNDEKGGITGTVNNSAGYFESARIRSKLKKQKEETFFSDMKRNFVADVEIENSGLEDIHEMEKPVSYHYDVKFPFNDESLVYFNPFVGTTLLKENPFKAADRSYPVEMPYCNEEVYILNMEIPKGYKVEEVPKSTRVKLNDDEGMFEYIIGVDAERIQFRSKLVLNKANYLPEDYQTLRDFFTYVVKKQSERIVFKKVN